MEGVTPNPLGGYVEARTTHDQSVGHTLWLRWVNETLHPMGDWHAVFTWQFWNQNHDWRVLVDRQGRALVLSFLYPPSLGAPPPRSEWKFSARWMAASGPLGDAFEPIAPIYTPKSSADFVLFADWGSILPLSEGGFAIFHEQAGPNAGGTISPVGWYVLYPSGKARTEPAPSWLQPYDGPLQLLAGGGGYAAMRRDSNTCARTAELIALSGRLCFTLPLEVSNLCGQWNDTFWPDGTFVVQNVCHFHWWPGLARPAQ
jgi:hypothetical protein